MVFYWIYLFGDIKICVKGIFDGVLLFDILCIGFNVWVNKDFDQVYWFGLGFGELYLDKKVVQCVGIFFVFFFFDFYMLYDVF